jgi:hypothetical protein
MYTGCQNFTVALSCRPTHMSSITIPVIETQVWSRLSMVAIFLHMVRLYHPTGVRRNRKTGYFEAHVVLFDTEKARTGWLKRQAFRFVFGRCLARISSRTPAFLTEYLLFLLSAFRIIPGPFLKLGHGCFLPYPFHHTIWRCKPTALLNIQ